MFEMPSDATLKLIEERNFGFPATDEQFDSLFEWLDCENRVAILDGGQGCKLAAVPIAAYHRMDNDRLKGAYLPHWGLDGLAIEDMPTMHDLLWAADENLLFDSLEETIGNAPTPGGKPNLSKALSFAKSMLSSLKEFEFYSCDEQPVVVMPITAYRADPSGEAAISEMRIEAFPLTALSEYFPEPLRGVKKYWWSEALGYKAWFGGVSTRESYQALAWFVCKLLRDSFVDYGIWFGELADNATSDYVKELSQTSRGDLRERMGDLKKRLVPLEELETVSFQVDEDVMQRFELLCRESGLSVQNALHIAILRFVKNPEGFIEMYGSNDSNASGRNT